MRKGFTFHTFQTIFFDFLHFVKQINLGSQVPFVASGSVSYDIYLLREQK